jgi:hypothetical protein
MKCRRSFSRVALVCLATLAVIASSGSVKAVAPAAAAGPVFVPGDLVISGDGVRWLHPDGSLVSKIEPDSFPTTAVAFRAGGGARPLYVVTDPLITRNYGPDGTYLYYFVLDSLAERTTDVALDSDGIGFLATRHGRLNQIFGFKEDPTRASGTQLVSFFVVDSQIHDLETAADACTLLVATQTLGVFRFDTCNFRVLPPLVANTAVSRVRLLPDATALLILPGQASIRRLDGSGSTVAEYTAPGVTGGWVALDLAPDGLSFWAATGSGDLYRFDLTTKAVVQGPLHVADTITDLAVANAPLGVAPPPGASFPSSSIDLDGVSPLTGATLTGVFPVSSSSRSTCATASSQVRYTDGFGVAIGPYPGRFQVQGTATLGSQSLPHPLGALGLSAGPIQTLRSAFTIAGQAPVTGTLTASAEAKPNIGTCATFSHQTFPNSPIFPPTVRLSGYEWSLSGEALSYDASIRKNGRSYVDTGLAYLYANRFHLLNEAGVDSGSGGRIAQYFVSSAIGVRDQFLRDKQSQRHTAGVPPKTTQLTVTTRWTNPRDRFSIVNLTLVVDGRSVASADGVGANKLPVKITRTRNSVTATVSRLRRGRLGFAVKADDVHGHSRATTTVHKTRRKTKTAFFAGS